MPKPLNADWNLAQTLYVQGVCYKAIAEKTGVTEVALRQRAHRHGWHALKTQSLEIVSRSVTCHTGKTLAQRSSEIRASLSQEIADSANALRDVPIEQDLAHLGDRAEVTQKLAASAAKVHDWGNEGSQGIIDMESMRLADIEWPTKPAAQRLDSDD